MIVACCRKRALAGLNQNLVSGLLLVGRVPLWAGFLWREVSRTPCGRFLRRLLGGGSPKKKIKKYFFGCPPAPRDPLSFGSQGSGPANPTDPADLADPADRINPADPANPAEPADLTGKKNHQPSFYFQEQYKKISPNSGLQVIYNKKYKSICIENLTYGPHKAVAEVSNHNEPIGFPTVMNL